MVRSRDGNGVRMMLLYFINEMENRGSRAAG